MYIIIRLMLPLNLVQAWQQIILILPLDLPVAMDNLNQVAMANLNLVAMVNPNQVATGNPNQAPTANPNQAAMANPNQVPIISLLILTMDKQDQIGIKQVRHLHTSL